MPQQETIKISSTSMWINLSQNTLKLNIDNNKALHKKGSQPNSSTSSLLILKTPFTILINYATLSTISPCQGIGFYVFLNKKIYKHV